MASTATSGSNHIQAIFTGVMVLFTFGLCLTMTMILAGRGTLLTIQTLVTAATFLAAVGLSAAVWKRPLLIHAMSAALMLVGLAALLLMTIYPHPSIAPLLSDSGAWVAGPIPIRVGWARLAMAIVILLMGLVLPFSQARRRFVALAALTFVRIGLWTGAFWLVAYVVLGGQFDRLFTGAAVGVQISLIAAMTISWLMLLRGDQRWLATFTEDDRTVSMARFVLPVALVPVLGAFLTTEGAKIGVFSPEVAPLLNIEMSSVTLLVVGAAALRSIWRERRRRENLAGALEQSPVIVYSEDGQIEYWPKGCEALYGFTPNEAVGRRGTELLQTEYSIPIEQIEETLQRTGEWAGEARQITRSGKSIWVASKVVIDQPSEDRGLKIVETLTDITDLKISRAALSDTSDSLAQAVATYELGIIEFDAELGRTSFSAEFERILGVGPGSLGTEEDAWQAWMSTDADADQLRGWFEADIAACTPKRMLTIQVRRADGEIRDLQGMLRYRYDPTGELKSLVGIFMDVTEVVRDRAEMAARGGRLLELQAELTHTSRLSAMGEMAAALAHELNQPLTAVGNSVGAIGMMLADETRVVDEKKRQQVLRAAKHAETQAVRAGEIVRRLRQFISRGEADTQVEDLDLLIADAVALALPNPTAAGITVQRFIERAASTVLADRIQIQQVMVNLVRNAVEAMKGQQRHRILTISATADNGMALVRVADTGAGVVPDAEAGLFSPFVSTKDDGMGVGLSICRRIIEAHGGEMSFQPAAGGGAEFRFTLPIISGEVSDDKY